MELNKIYLGHCLEVLKSLPNEFVNTCVTSPPYWGLRDYGMGEQIGLEETPEQYVSNLVNVFREVKRVLKNDGTLWLNLGDSYFTQRNSNGLSYKNDHLYKHGNNSRRAGGKHNELKSKDLVGIPWMVAFALRQNGWYLRSDIIWNKPNPMPESVRDRPTKSHEYIFLLSKSDKYYYDKDVIMEPLAESSVARLNQDLEGQRGSTRANGGAKTNGTMKAVFTPRGSKGVINNSLNTGLRIQNDDFVPPINRNKRSVWTISTKPYKEAHFATYPPELVEPCVLAGAPIGGVVLDPFFGSGTTGLVAIRHNRNFVGIELNPKYIKIAEKRLSEVQLELINEI
ncbi:DNA-methyltransferase [Evansella tamaricis]|uniref:Site-specific DNA-methyltransferase n=1 Tax=Evansella tamaricis TaxID=2069301 RepID=A0ABS6JD11_9BACI|nr:site-specific DNA-methyltransferase [Evansella tamaricis]MBU9711084.1 site-specific DNA-methyltransferase [Evansella tamaricis]